jgi:hypothetical protein
MARGPSKFTQSDITRAVKGVVAAGVDVIRVEVDTSGRIIVIAGKLGNIPPVINPLDKWMADHAGAT